VDGWSDSPTWAANAPAVTGGGSGYPPARWPSMSQLTYTKEAITVLLLVLALPWLLTKLATDPGAILSGLGRRAANKSV
jgi:hypothetical protein